MSSNLKHRWTGDRFREPFANGLPGRSLLLFTGKARDVGGQGWAGKTRNQNSCTFTGFNRTGRGEKCQGKERKGRPSPGPSDRGAAGKGRGAFRLIMIAGWALLSLSVSLSPSPPTHLPSPAVGLGKVCLEPDCPSSPSGGRRAAKHAGASPSGYLCSPSPQQKKKISLNGLPLPSPALHFGSHAEDFRCSWREEQPAALGNSRGTV